MSLYLHPIIPIVHKHLFWWVHSFSYLEWITNEYTLLFISIQLCLGVVSTSWYFIKFLTFSTSCHLLDSAYMFNNNIWCEEFWVFDSKSQSVACLESSVLLWILHALRKEPHIVALSSNGILLIKFCAS